VGALREPARRGAAHPASPFPPGSPKPAAWCWEWPHYSYIFALLRPFAGSSSTCTRGPWLGVQPAEAPNTPPKTIPPLPILPPFNFSPFPEELDAEGRMLAQLRHCLGWGRPGRSAGAGGRSCILGSFALLRGWVSVFLCLPGE